MNIVTFTSQVGSIQKIAIQVIWWKKNYNHFTLLIKATRVESLNRIVTSLIISRLLLMKPKQQAVQRYTFICAKGSDKQHVKYLSNRQPHDQ